MQNADNSRILLFKTNGVVLNIPTDYKEIVAGDELMVLPKVDVKRLEIAKGFSLILYLVAIATRSLLLWSKKPWQVWQFVNRPRI